MDLSFLLDPEFLQFLVIPAFIFFARILDVSMDTIRIIFISRDMRYLAPVLGFFEMIVWLLAIGQIMLNLGNLFNYIAYAAGFAMGTFVGMLIEETLAMGYLSVIITTSKDPAEMVGKLDMAGFKITVVDTAGGTKERKMIFAIIKRDNLRHIINIIKEVDPNVFYAVENVKDMREIHLPPDYGARKRALMMKFGRKKAA